MKKDLYIGTYTSGLSQGIYHLEIEDGKMSEARLFCPIRNPKYLCRYEDKIVSIADYDKGCGLALIDIDGNILDEIIYEEVDSCYVTKKGNRIYTANYHEGTLSCIEIDSDRFHMRKKLEIGEKAGCHQVLFHEDKILLPSLFLDRIIICDEELNPINEIVFPKGSGPRHGVFSKDHKTLYVVSELSNELFVIDSSDWRIKDSFPVLLNKEKNVEGTAAIRLSEEEKYLYVSTRGKNILSVFSIEDNRCRLIQNADCHGDHPRDFILDGKYLFCANRFSNEVVSFVLDENGLIKEEIDRKKVPEAVALLL